MKILIRGTNWVGDAVMTIPAMRELRRAFPEAHLALHTRSWAEGIFRDADFLDEIITFDRTGSKVRDAVAQAAALRPRHFELAVLFPNSFESALITKLAWIPRRIGYARDGRSFLLTDAVVVPDWKDRRHEVYDYLTLVGQVERLIVGPGQAAGQEPVMNLAVSEMRRAGAREILEKHGVDLSRRTVALGVGSTNSRAKRWPAERYATLNDLLQRDAQANVILVGARDETAVAEEVASLSERRPVIMTGETELAEAVAVLSEVDLLVSNDMGLAHIAPAVGTRTIVIFGPTNDRTTRPFSNIADVIRRDVDCAPCMLRDCPIDHRCMTGISPEEVFDKAVTALAARGD